MLFDPFTIVAIFAMFHMWILPQSGHPSLLQFWLSGPEEEFEYTVMTLQGLSTRTWSRRLQSDIAPHLPIREYVHPLDDFVITPTVTVTTTTTVTSSATPTSNFLSGLGSPVFPSAEIRFPAIANYRSPIVGPQASSLNSRIRLLAAVGLALAAASSTTTVSSKPKPKSSLGSKPAKGRKRRSVRPGTIVYKDIVANIASTFPLPPSNPPSPVLSTVSVPVPVITVSPPPLDLSSIMTMMDIPPSSYVVVPPPAGPANPPSGALRHFDPRNYGLPGPGPAGPVPPPAGNNGGNLNRPFQAQDEQTAAALAEFQRRYPRTGQQHRGPRR